MIEVVTDGKPAVEYRQLGGTSVGVGEMVGTSVGLGVGVGLAWVVIVYESSNALAGFDVLTNREVSVFFVTVTTANPRLLS